MRSTQYLSLLVGWTVITVNGLFLDRLATIDVTVVFPLTASEGQILQLQSSDGEMRTVMVPQDFETGIQTTLNRGMIIPSMKSVPATTSQVHLHHSPNITSASSACVSTSSQIAISWSTPKSTENCSVVKWGEINGSLTQSTWGVTRSYPKAKLSDGTTNASFHHVVLTTLSPGQRYFYTVGCDMATPTLTRSFRAPTECVSPSLSSSSSSSALSSSSSSSSSLLLSSSSSYSFAIFGDLGISSAARDTVDSMLSQINDLDFVMHIGDISYAEGKEAIWNTFVSMIEPVASTIPWDVVPGNHDMRPADSGGECGVPMLARFETPRSRQAFASVLQLSPTGSGARQCDSFNEQTDDPFWYAYNIPYARVITYSTDSNYSKGTRQYAWLEQQLSAANTPSSRAVRPWVLLCGHKPMYTSSEYPGELRSRDQGAAAQEGTEGSLTAALESLFVTYKVDVSFYGHIHSYNRMYPVKNNGTWVDNSSFSVYKDPQAPVHMMIGMAGAGHLGKPFDNSQKWSATSDIAYGWLKATFANASAFHLEFVANGDGGDGDGVVDVDVGGVPSVRDEVWITKSM